MVEAPAPNADPPGGSAHPHTPLIREAPVIGSSIPGIVEHIGDGRGLLIRHPLDAHSIASALKNAFTLDEASYHAIVERGRRYAERSLFHDQEAMALLALASPRI